MIGKPSRIFRFRLLSGARTEPIDPDDIRAFAIRTQSAETSDIYYPYPEEDFIEDDYDQVYHLFPPEPEKTGEHNSRRSVSMNQSRLRSKSFLFSSIHQKIDVGSVLCSALTGTESLSEQFIQLLK